MPDHHGVGHLHCHLRQVGGRQRRCDGERRTGLRGDGRAIESHDPWTLPGFQPHLQLPARPPLPRLRFRAEGPNGSMCCLLGAEKRSKCLAAAQRSSRCIHRAPPIFFCVVAKPERSARRRELVLAFGVVINLCTRALSGRCEIPTSIHTEKGVSSSRASASISSRPIAVGAASTLASGNGRTALCAQSRNFASTEHR